MQELLENLAGVKVGQTVFLRIGSPNVEVTSTASHQQVFVAGPATPMKVVNIDLHGGFVEVQGPNGLVGSLSPSLLAGGRSF
jgi:hypothetical protein